MPAPALPNPCLPHLLPPRGGQFVTCLARDSQDRVFSAPRQRGLRQPNSWAAFHGAGWGFGRNAANAFHPVQIPRSPQAPPLAARYPTAHVLRFFITHGILSLESFVSGQ